MDYPEYQVQHRLDELEPWKPMTETFSTPEEAEVFINNDGFKRARIVKLIVVKEFNFTDTNT